MIVPLMRRIGCSIQRLDRWRASEIEQPDNRGPLVLPVVAAVGVYRPTADEMPGELVAGPFDIGISSARAGRVFALTSVEANFELQPVITAVHADGELLWWSGVNEANRMRIEAGDTLLRIV